MSFRIGDRVRILGCTNTGSGYLCDLCRSKDVCNFKNKIGIVKYFDKTFCQLEVRGRTTTIPISRLESFMVDVERMKCF